MKDWANPSTICYCFNWTKEKISNKTKAIEDISEKMNSIGCNCENNNPSGKCCLKDIKKAVKELTQKE